MAETASETEMSAAPATGEPRATGYSWYVLGVLVVVTMHLSLGCGAKNTGHNGSAPGGEAVGAEPHGDQVAHGDPVVADGAWADSGELMPCGDNTCRAGAELCFWAVNDVAGEPQPHECRAAPMSCTSTDCDCILSALSEVELDKGLTCRTIDNGVMLVRPGG